MDIFSTEEKRWIQLSNVPANVHEGHDPKEQFATREEHRAEVVMRRKPRQDYAADKKQITKELRLEIKAHKTINNHVLGLRQTCIPFNEAKQMPKSGVSEDKKADKAGPSTEKLWLRRGPSRRPRTTCLS